MPHDPLGRAAELVDVVVIGAGGGGYPAAFLLDGAGKSVLMVDPIGNLGGNCLAEGCIPSKAVREAGLLRARMLHGETFGLAGAVPETSWPGVLAHKDRVQRTRYAQHERELAGSTIRFVHARARIVDVDLVEIEDAGGTERFRFRDLILATGSAPARLAITGAELALTSHDLFRLGADLSFPERPIIIGGGYIGVETASMLANLGASPTVIEATDALLPGFDPALASGLTAALRRCVHIETHAPVRRIERRGEVLAVVFARDGQEHALEGDVIIMATGRHVVLPGGVEHLGLDPRRPPIVDAQLRTANPHVYAPGDVNARTPLFHAAVRQSVVAAHVILAGGQPVDAMDFDAVPTTVFTDPEVAAIGLTEAGARARFGAASVGRYDFAEDSRAQILDETEGFISLVFEGVHGALVGAHILGIDAAQLAAPLALAIQARLDAAALATVAFPHPMASEGIARAARAVRP
jgi:dihydrolipoamide dehydrogenase